MGDGGTSRIGARVGLAASLGKVYTFLEFFIIFLLDFFSKKKYHTGRGDGDLGRKYLAVRNTEVSC